VEVDSVFLIRVTSQVDKDVDHPQFYDPSYPLKTIQAGLELYGDVTVNILDCWIHPMDVPQMVEHVQRYQPDLVVVSASSFDITVAKRLMVSLKRQENAPLVVGIGQGYYLQHDFFMDDSESEYDAVLLGEPEEEFFRFFEWIRKCDPKDQSDGKRYTVNDPDSLAFANYTPEELRAYKSIFPVKLSKEVVWGYLIATRGCPYDCTFCSEVMRVSIGKKLRGRTPANIVDEMEHLANQGVNICSFQDDSFSSNRNLVKALCEELIARNSKMPWMCRGRIDEVNYETLTLMKKAGCVMMGFGVEAGSQRIVDDMIKQYKDRPWQDMCRQTFKWTRELGIGTNAYFIIGNPTETREEIQQTIDLALELNTDTIQVHFYTPYPGSTDWEKYKDQIEKSDAENMYHYAAPKFNPSEVSSEELVTLRSKFYRRYIFRPSFAIPHFWRHAGFYWHNPDIFWSLVGIRKVFGTSATGSIEEDTNGISQHRTATVRESPPG
jgi:radical SAM superfamily enzyme YgiQ (UPF0313 family)